MNYLDAMNLLSQSDLGMLLVSGDGLILEANDAAARLLHSSGPLKGKSFPEAAPLLASPPEDGSYINIAFGKYLALCPCPEGFPLPEGTRMVCFRDVSGKMFTHMLEAIIHLIPEPMILADSNQRVLLVNDATMRMESLVPEDVIGKDIAEVYPAARTSSRRESFNELTVPVVLRTGESLLNCRQTYSTKTGQTLDISCNSYPIYRDGNIVGVFCLTADLSRAEELSRQVIELQERLLGTDKPIGGRCPDPGKTAGVRNGLYARYNFRDIVCHSALMKEVIRKCHIFAKSDSPIMIYGETGTGKELFAQSIHNASPRALKPFIAINCAAIPENLLESMLFGTEKGAYTGAEKRPGLFEQADGGTLLLDELNSMSLPLQAKLLRVLQDGMVRRIGGTEEKHVDVRVISNVNIPPSRALSEGIIREDVFYRLSVISVTVPPLRERREDIPILARTFFVALNRKLGKSISRLNDDVLSLFYLYDWPGNVRELQHCIEHAMNLAGPEETELCRHHLPEHLLRRLNLRESASDGIRADKKLEQLLFSVESNMIEETFRKHRGNISRTAKELGISRQNLQHRLKRLSINPDSFTEEP
ncbi:MAG: sigma 54-interacting transcriptional regulator [Clostridium sp.]|nr:sigma 54-interacting transcriptional regulator [Clostridium sp.]